MSDAVLDNADRQYSPTYKPLRDRERQKARMRLERAKNKAGFNNITVKAWLALMANKATTDE